MRNNVISFLRFTSYLFSLCIPLLLVGCEGCGVAVDDDGPVGCPDVPPQDIGDFAVKINTIQAGGGSSAVQALPEPWTNLTNFTSNHQNKHLWYVKFRITGWCDPDTKEEPLIWITEGATGQYVEPAIVNGEKAFIVKDVPLNRLLNVKLWLNEPCLESQACGMCIPEEHSGYRTKRVGNFPDYIELNDAIEITLFPNPEADCCD